MTSVDVGCDGDWRECSGGWGSEEKASELLWWVEKTRMLWNAEKHEEPVPGSTASLMLVKMGPQGFTFADHRFESPQLLLLFPVAERGDDTVWIQVT